MKDTANRKALRLHRRGRQALHKIQPKYFPTLTLKSLVKALQPYVVLFFSSQILTELATLRRVDFLRTWAIAGVLTTGAMALLAAFLEERCETLLDDLWGRKEILFIQKLFNMDFEDMDKQETHDLRAQIQQNENWSAWGLMRIPTIYELTLTSLISIASGLLMTIGLFRAQVPASGGRLTLLNHPIFLLAMILLMVGMSLLAGRLAARAEQSWSASSDEATEANRFFGHFGFTGMDRKRSVDIRMNNQQDLIQAYMKTTNAFGVDGTVGKAARGKMGLDLGLGASLASLVTGFVYAFTCLKALGGAFDVGSITRYVGAATAMAGSLSDLVAILGVIQANTSYLDQTFTYLDLPRAMASGDLPLTAAPVPTAQIEFRDVSFRYPGSDRWSLRHVNMTLHAGERLAIVGENGSGKTTFIKLLCRLYDPQEGAILLNGRDIRDYRYADYLGIFSVVFQDFQLISQPLGANVAGRADYDPDRARQALIDAGFGDRLASLDQGLDTMLYKDLTEDGVEISGGEAQKIAIARALYKDAPLLILDEPTAALDPVAEAEIYSRFNEIAGHRTAIYISHRLASCKFCDRIAVFHEGRVIQTGSHADLLADPTGQYYALWQAQAQYYVK